MSASAGGLDNRHHGIQAYMKSQKIFMCIGSNSSEGITCSKGVQCPAPKCRVQSPALLLFIQPETSYPLSCKMTMMIAAIWWDHYKDSMTHTCKVLQKCLAYKKCLINVRLLHIFLRKARKNSKVDSQAWTDYWASFNISK